MRLQLTIPPSSTPLRAVRRVIEGWARAHDVASGPLTLIATELLANAMAVCPPDVDIELVLDLEGEEVTLSVTDCGPTAFDPGEILRPDVDSVRGRGLHIVQTLSNRLTIDRVEGRTVITAHQYRWMLANRRDDQGSSDQAGAERGTW